LFREVRRFTETICAPLQPEDFVPQSMTEASPVKWQIAHVTWFFEQFVLSPFAPGYATPWPGFAYLFNSYYNAVGDRVARGSRGLLTRPSLETVWDYRRGVEEGVLDLLANYGGPRRQEMLRIIELGCHHEQQHQELILTDLKHLLFQNPLRPAYQQPCQTAAHRPSPTAADRGEEPLAPPHWVEFEGGVRRVGYDGRSFHFDNEGPPHRRFLEPFSLADRPVTNREFLEFMAGGGYRRAELWLDDGWSAARSGQWEAPLYWERDGDGWSVFTLQGMRPLVLEEPVSHVSFYEADAYARWAGARLPAEEEWEVACRHLPVAGNFAESRRFHPTPLLGRPSAVSGDPAAPGDGLAAAPPIREAFGNLWEWTASPYLPYPGYAPAAGALGEYNGKFMCNQMVLRGGSCATPQSHIRSTYRNFFYPQARWQFSGIRLARSGR